MNQIKDDFYQRYFEQYFNLFVFAKESEDQGKLYEVEWILRITDPEMD